jgi:hypothetical protein
MQNESFQLDMRKILWYVLRKYVENYVWNIGLYFKSYKYGDSINISGFMTGIGLWEIIYTISKGH